MLWAEIIKVDEKHHGHTICPKCNHDSWLIERDGDVCPNCLDWDHEIVRECYD